ncbi:hypothetical protein Q4561_13555 [Alteromonas sp. 1_MG-2023]|uniref:hypothetical protein n=1 Tax=Alteromonas sp. 1_MG-2023 TaxID=3062669 RepID=UPI0026E3EA73|nr:hypothetical protein [Alteromonas sp. 1_MG-2023]MDO6568094.1 hypothetical protein [Alteromonas sp. 1_MG-2023]
MQSANHENLRASLAPTDQIQVAAIFEDKLSAKQTIQQLANSTNVSTDQVSFIDASDTQISQKLEQESKHIGKNLWHSHLMLGGIGLLVGILAAFLLVSFGPELTQQNPLFTYIALISPGIFTGLFVAGLVGLRPDRSEIVQAVRHAIRRNHVAVVINLKKSQSASDISSFLHSRSKTVVEAVR